MTPAWAIDWCRRGFHRGKTRCRRWPAIISIAHPKLRQAVIHTNEACRLWDEIMATRSTIPSPFSAAEIGIMFVMVTRHGTEIAVNFLKDVLREVNEKVARGKA